MELITQILLIGFLLVPAVAFYVASSMATTVPAGRYGPATFAAIGVALTVLLLAIELLVLSPVMAVLDYAEDLFRDFFALGIPQIYAARPVAAAGATGLLTVINVVLMTMVALWDPMGRALEWLERATAGEQG